MCDKEEENDVEPQEPEIDRVMEHHEKGEPDVDGAKMRERRPGEIKEVPEGLLKKPRDGASIREDSNEDG